jgi:hypothetical protein
MFQATLGVELDVGLSHVRAELNARVARGV